jgi:hypothetical protein
MTEIHPISDRHAPDPAFRGYLEGEVIAAHRAGRTLRRLRWAAMIVVSIGIGTTASIASAQVRERAQRDSILQAAQSDAMMASMNLNLARMQLDAAKKQFDIGVSSRDAMRAAETYLRVKEAETARAALVIEEVKATALPPRDELNAPLVGGKDFVTSRLQLQLMVAQTQLEEAEAARAEAARRVRAGVVAKTAELDADLEVRKAMGALSVLMARQSGRADFLERHLSIEEIDRKVERASVTADLQVAQLALSLAAERVSLIRKQKDVGMVGEMELLRAELEVRERQIEVQRLSARLAALR